MTGHGRAAHVLSAGNDVEATSAAIEIGMELSREEVLSGLAEVGYVAEPQLAMAITLMRRLQRPLLLEGEAGVGKTEVGKALARMLERPLIRLQCYEGLDANAAVYEWNYQRQLLAIKIRESEELSAEAQGNPRLPARFFARTAAAEGNPGARAGGAADR